MTLSPALALAHTRSSARSAPAAWAKSIALAIRGSDATSRSRSSRRLFSADPERLRRFEQEARAAAALNHPNILAVHDIGQHDGAPYIVSELLEGETLRERPRTRARSRFAKAVEYAIQIAHGLAAAHEKGHRPSRSEAGERVRHQLTVA